MGIHQSEFHASAAEYAFMSKLKDTILELYGVKDALERRLVAVNQAIEKAEQLNSQLEALGPDAIQAMDSELIKHEKAQATQTRARNTLSPRKIAEAARAVLLEAGKPLKRGDIVNLLERNGVILSGKDRNKNLGTILWRHPDMFTVIGDLGYWPKDVPLEGVYDPSVE